MKARKIELIEKAVPEDEDEDDQGDEPAPAPDEESAEPEPEPAPEEETVEPEPAPEEETVEPEPEPKEEPDVMVAANGTIAEVDESKGTMTVELDDGSKITLDIDQDCDISSGYFPEKDDVVEIKYMKKAMLLKVIKLIDRPTPPEAEEAAEEEAEE